MIACQNGYNMAFTKRKEVGKRYTFTADDTIAIGKCRCHGHYCIGTERAAIGI